MKTIPGERQGSKAKVLERFPNAYCARDYKNERYVIITHSPTTIHGTGKSCYGAWIDALEKIKWSDKNARRIG